MKAFDIMTSDVASDAERDQALREWLASDAEVAQLVCHYIDCRNLGVPVDVSTAVAEASSPDIAREAGSLMRVADVLLKLRAV